MCCLSALSPTGLVVVFFSFFKFVLLARDVPPFLSALSPNGLDFVFKFFLLARDAPRFLSALSPTGLVSRVKLVHL